MNENGYSIEIGDVAGEVAVLHEGQTVAFSDRARVLRETRLADCYYFPVDAVDPDILIPSDQKTFCPFKGTASYWHVKTPSGIQENGAWSYQRPLAEARGIGGYLCFTDAVAQDYDFSVSPPDVRIEEAHISSPLSDWVLRGAGNCKTRRELARMLGHKLVEAGIGVSRMSVVLWSLHPEIAGTNIIWKRDTDEAILAEASYDLLDDPEFVNSPIYYVSMAKGGVRQPLNVDVFEFDYPIIHELKAAGATDYVAMPLPFSDGQINVITLASDSVDGFSTADLGQIFEIVGAIGRYFEVLTLRKNTQTLLDTYLGRRTGIRVLNGDIRRGLGEDIQAVILFSDLRNSTRLAEELPRDDYLKMLNRYYDMVLAPISENGGEVLKFIGDAVLAVFPVSDLADDRAGQAELALRSARQAMKVVEQNLEKGLTEDGPPIDMGIALHIGDVTYGNIGSHDRLDFTVIGPAVNLATRMEGLCKATGNKIIMSRDFVHALESNGDSLPQNVFSIGSHRFDGFESSQEIYAAGNLDADVEQPDAQISPVS
ncbi:DUF427 domain-containing protein [Hoeflea sp. WL0058]|uniref:DUF427 domain-containing protein n=1 Tax=Flavimaribacter sediminis TaxID=2865987 RepID=A0AAE3D3V7_9HYPH|nr:DUF427 domain-containing protein [Flavimaribacter sediminis]MBW8640507.1 DUF427 domain-containing protein [Flavimaribacter sediminis]